MYLRTLTLKGFKSFAQTAVIDLAPGLSVIVGPNGSGKSNIVDAISWVLGSQAPTALRSQQMDEVIFAGNPGRPALGRAEVTLTFSNEDRRLPVDLAEVAISRTLFRSGDSSYAINGAPARLIDIAELLAVAGVGRHRHVIVSQGRIDAVLNAKPTERRAILEEAAGVSAYRLRKDKALRRLADTEANLARLGDQLSEARRALRPLEQQAAVARRHGAMAAELSALQIYRLGAELSDLRRRGREAATRRRDLADRRAAAGRQLAVLNERIGTAESRLAGMGHMRLAEASERLAVLRDRAETAQRAIEELRRGDERRRAERLASDLVATLSDEAAQLEVALDETGSDQASLAGAEERIAAATRELEVDDEAHRARRRRAGVDDRSSAELRGRLAALGEAAERAEAEEIKLTESSRRLRERLEEVSADAGRAGEEVTARRDEEAAAAEVLEGATERRAEVTAAETAARTSQGEAAAELGRWRSRVEALALAMGDVRDRSGMEVLSGAAGVLGTLGDLVAVDEGWEGAFEAAVGEALAAAVVEDPDAARPALVALSEAQVAGAVLGGHLHPGEPPPVGEPLRPHVRARSKAVAAVLDGIIGSVAVVPSWREALDAVEAHPDTTVVTLAGDCFSRVGWRVGVTRTGATGQALEESRESLRLARGALGAADRAVEEAESATAAASSDHAAAAGVHRATVQRLGEARRRATEIERRQASVSAEAEAAGGRLPEAVERARQQRLAVEETAALLTERIAAEQAAEASDRSEREELDRRRAALAAERHSLQARMSEIRTRRSVLSDRLEEIRSRLGSHDAAVAAAGADARRSAVLANLAERLSVGVRECQEGLEQLRARRRRAAAAIAGAAAQLESDRRRRGDVASLLEELATDLLAAQRSEDELGLRVSNAVETLREKYDCDDVRAVSSAEPALPEGTTIDHRIRELERLLRGIGPVNPLAVREHDLLRERHDRMASQIEDVRSARRDLTKLVRSIDAEITDAFSRCYHEVAASFESLFGILFEGGVGRLRLTEPGNPLDSGVEIEAQPPGKNPRRLALLSGGERSLAALAFLFAVFQSQRSPFYILDEVDAALDDVNLHRFLRLVEEFRSQAQLVLVSHQKPTMDIADCLYGVTMRPGSSSRVIAERRSAGDPVVMAATGGRAG